MKLVFLFSLLLIRLPTLLNRTKDPLIWGASLAPFWVVIVHQLVVKPRREAGRVHLMFGLREAIPALLFLGMVLASFPRASASGAIGPLESLGHMYLWATVAIFAGTIFWVRPADGHHRFERRLDLTVHALGIYVLSNVVLYLIGFQSQRAIYAVALYRPATILAGAGVQAERVLFPMASGFASFGVVAGACLVASVLAFDRSQNRWLRAWLTLVVISSGIAILLTDTRSAMLYALLSIGAVILVPRLLASISSVLPLLAGLVPVVLVGVAPLLSRSEQVEPISRSPADVATLNSRTYVWSAGLEALRPRNAEVLFGYGFEGQFTSRVSELYATRFATFIRSNTIGLHNALLQYGIDVGVAGAFLYLACFALMMNALVGGGRDLRGRRAVFGLGVFLLLAGGTDSVPTPYSQELFAVFWLLLISACSVHAKAAL